MAPSEWHKDYPLAETPAVFCTAVGGKPIHSMHLRRDTGADESRVKLLLHVKEIQAAPKACLAEENKKWPVGKERQENVMFSPCQSITQLGCVLMPDTWKFKILFPTWCQLNVRIYSFKVNGYSGDFLANWKIKDYTSHIIYCKCGSSAELTHSSLSPTRGSLTVKS